MRSVRRPRSRRRFASLPIVSVIALAVVSISALTAANVVPGSKAADLSQSVSPAEFAPPECVGMTLDNIVVGSGTFSGTVANNLMLGSSGVDSISGLNGGDCIVGGDGIDTLTGGPGTDVCVGGGGIDVFVTCETQIQ